MIAVLSEFREFLVSATSDNFLSLLPKGYFRPGEVVHATFDGRIILSVFPMSQEESHYSGIFVSSVFRSPFTGSVFAA